MPDTILIVVEQREGKLNRVSWETITAGQAIAAATGWTLEAAVVGGSTSSFAAEVAAKQPKLVLMPHTYQVRDFVPKLATAMGRTVISDCIGFKYDGGKLVFTRQMF